MRFWLSKRINLKNNFKYLLRILSKYKAYNNLNIRLTFKPLSNYIINGVTTGTWTLRFNLILNYCEMYSYVSEYVIFNAIFSCVSSLSLPNLELSYIFIINENICILTLMLKVWFGIAKETGWRY